MKVLFTFGGMPHYLCALLNKIQKKGVDITVVTPRKGNAIIGAGVKMVDGGEFTTIETHEKEMRWKKVGFPELDEIIEVESPDIVVLGWPYFLQYYFQSSLRRAIKKCGAKLMIREIPFQTPPDGQIKEYFTAHPMYTEGMTLVSKGMGFYLRQRFTAHIRRYVYERMAGTLNYSSAAYDILPSYGVPREKIHVTYNTSDTDALLSQREKVLNSAPILPPCSKRILHIGRLVKWKRVDLLIDALPSVLLKHPDAELVVVGDGPEDNNLKEQADRLGLTFNIRFVGAVYTPEVLGAYMNESTVYVLAGMGGLSINDAMTYGMPVICSVCDSTERDLVHEVKNGFFFEEDNAESLAERINTLFDSPELIASMGQESERIIREEINLETVSDRYVEAFRSVM